MDELRIACIGAGSSGTCQMAFLERFAPGSVVAFCDLDRTLFDTFVTSRGYLDGDPTDASRIRPDFLEMPFYTDPEEMFAKEDINTVLIATHCSAHYEMVRKCVEHGMNILLEKPVAITEEDVDGCWRLLRDYPHVVTVNFSMRSAPVSLAARKHVRDGAIGRIVSVQYVNNVDYGDTYFRKWMRTRDKIGSLLLQKATHDFDIINSIIGLKPAAIAAFGSRLVYGGEEPNDLTCDECSKKWDCPMSVYLLRALAGRCLPPRHVRKCVYAREIDIDDSHVVIIQYEGGVTASYSQTFNAPARAGQRGGYFIGTDGIMHLKYYGDFVESPQGQTLVGNSHIDIKQYHQKAGSHIHEVYDWGGHVHFDGTNKGIMGKLDLLRGRPPEAANTIEEGYISAKMCLAAQKSIETGSLVSLDLNL